MYAIGRGAACVGGSSYFSDGMGAEDVVYGYEVVGMPLWQSEGLFQSWRRVVEVLRRTMSSGSSGVSVTTSSSVPPCARSSATPLVLESFIFQYRGYACENCPGG